ncbi:NAD-dependent epimerase [Nonlabens ulvanivorans]|uniref:NAD-dependent epimerase n=2 Tax=Nonlabens ulvanivorans TaxID=906888 RepID=A0A084JV58_NONUL|nr:NAD-dependent epimerase [Nonlabens ulvanivorans]
MMKIIIAGGTGFLGISLSQYFENRGDEVITLSRKCDPQTTYWNGKDLGEWTAHLENADVLINLAGKSVDCRYTNANKKVILSSRIDSTRVLNLAMTNAINKPKVFLNASTATIYIHSETQMNTEENGIIGDDFSMGIGKAWEKEFFSTTIEGVRKVALRTSIMLGNDGGALPKMKAITRVGMGGKNGRGNQFVSWIHINDFCRSIEFLIQSDLEGVVNITAPKPETNADFMRQLRKSMNIPFGISQPIWLLELGTSIIGTETELLLKSRNVYPQRLIDAGFQFNYDNIGLCLKDLS